MTNEIDRLKKMYTDQYNPDPEDRNYIWNPLNPIAIYYRQAQERAVADLLRKYYSSLAQLNVLDIGCGNGNLLRFLTSLGFSPGQLSGIDLMEYRIKAACQLAPLGIAFLIGDGAALPYPDKCFNLVAQSTVFSSIQDIHLRLQVASEMRRVLQSGGHVVWYDMFRTRNASLHQLPLPEIRELFPGMEILHVQKLHPIYAAQILRYGRFITEIWENLPGIAKTHYLIFLQKP